MFAIVLTITDAQHHHDRLREDFMDRERRGQ
jgi:hypothetical protein